MDGYFVPDMASGPSIVKELKEITDILLDVHLMVETPEKIVPAFLEAGADSITYHAEATNNGMHIIQMVKEQKKENRRCNQSCNSCVIDSTNFS